MKLYMLLFFKELVACFEPTLFALKFGSNINKLDSMIFFLVLLTLLAGLCYSFIYVELLVNNQISFV